jgi:uncharacterized Zn-finger protein
MSELISSFIEHAPQDLETKEGSYDPFEQYNAVDLYELLLHKPQLQHEENNMEPLSTNNLIALNNEITMEPSSTINPKELNSHHGSISGGSSSDEFDNLDDNGSVSSDDTISHNTPRPRNWSMNDEFHDAINTWLRENERTKRNSISALDSSRPRFSSDSHYRRTSVTKRRKSESHITTSLASTSSHSTKSSTPNISSSSSVQPQSGEEEEKPFKCDSCPKAFRRSEHLKRHVRSVHSNVRPFPCKFCEKKFSRSDNLAQHLRTHNRQ